MRQTLFLYIFLCSVHTLVAQVYQGLVVPDKKGRFATASEITQASGLALDVNGTSLWTHNDQGNPTTKLYKILTASGESNITIQKTVNILNVQNLDWEDLAKDDAGNLYICQTGKNCNANSDPVECPTRFVFKIHRVSLTSLNHVDSISVTPQTFYFKYPLSGYDVNNCNGFDTVFVNGEATIWFNNAIYVFSKNIWSKPTNNCGGWTEGYTYMFKVPLNAGSSMANPIVAQYLGKVNLKMQATELAAKYQVTGAAISPDQSMLSFITYGRIWQFRNFTGDQFFSGNRIYADYSNTGSDTITRGYEGVEFMNNQSLTLCVDGVNGRLSGINADSIALWVRNANDSGPGSLRNAIASGSQGDTMRFKSSLFNDTILLTSGALNFSRSMNLIQNAGQTILLRSNTSGVISIPLSKSLSLKNINLIGGNVLAGCILNAGILSLENVDFYQVFPGTYALMNNGSLTLKGNNRFFLQ